MMAKEAKESKKGMSRQGVRRCMEGGQALKCKMFTSLMIVDSAVPISLTVIDMCCKSAKKQEELDFCHYII